MKRILLTVLIAALALPALTACAAAPVELHYHNFENRRLPLTLSLAPVTIDLDNAPAPEAPFARTAVSIDPLEVEATVLNEIEYSRLFKSVVLSGGNTASADVQLDLKIFGAELAFEGFEDWDTTLLYWFLAWVPSWYHADETWSIRWKGEMTLTSLHTGKLLYKRRFSIRYARNLDDFERGWQLYGLFRVPESLTDENFSAATRSLMPLAANRLAVAVTETLCENFYERTRHPAFNKRLRGK